MMMTWYLIEWQLTMMITMEIPTLEIRTSRFLISFCSKVTNRLYCMYEFWIYWKTCLSKRRIFNIYSYYKSM